MCVFQFLFWFSLIYLLVSSYVLYPSYILFICVCFSLRVCLLGWLFVRPFLGSFVGLFVWLFVCLYHYAFIDFPISTCMYCIYTNIHIYNYIYTYIHHHYRITNHHKSLFHCHQAAQIPQQVPLKNQSKELFPPLPRASGENCLKGRFLEVKKKTRAPLSSSSSSSSSCPYQGTSSLSFRRKPAWARRSCKSWRLIPSSS